MKWLSIDGHDCLFLFVRQRGRHVIIEQEGRGFLRRRLPHAVHAPAVLLQVPATVEASGAEVAGERPLAGVDDDVSVELRATLLVFAADVTDETRRRPRSVGMDNLAVPLQVTEASEAAAAEVTGIRSQLAVDQRVTRQQRLEFENFTADVTRECSGLHGAPPAARSVWRVVHFDLQVDAQVMLLQAGGTLEAAQTDAAAVRLVCGVDVSVSCEKSLGLESLPTDATGERRVGRGVLLVAQLVGVDQDLVSFELMLSGELASADVAEMRPLAGVSLEVDEQLRSAFKLFTAEVAEQRTRPLRLGARMDNLLVVLEVVGPHVGFGAEVAAVRFDP